MNAALIFCSASAEAGQITYTIENAGPLTGTVTTDSSSGVIVAGNFSYLFSGTTYTFSGTPSVSNPPGASDFESSTFGDATGHYFYLDFVVPPLPSGNFPLCSTSFGNCYSAGKLVTDRLVDSGLNTLSTLATGDITPPTASPEPATFLLVGIGAFTLAFAYAGPGVDSPAPGCLPPPL